ncbi:membrane protein [Candidatus Pelagibacter sp. IMCC9063]|nr:membrane protein [Candidatus Pelagibacter sp. IMCC9063]
MGTFLNAIIIAAMIDLSIAFIPTPELYISKFLMLVCGVLLVGFGSGLYLIANLGPGPRDGLMTGLQRKTNLPIAVVRAFIEITVATVGWYLGGTLGEGTLLFAFGIGPAVALGLFLVSRFYAKN